MSECHLLSLPRELRDWISSHVLVPYSPQRVLLSFEETFHGAPSQLAILQTCHQINREASLIFYASSVFETRLNSVNSVPNLRKIPRTISQNARHVRIVLDFEIPIRWDGHASGREAEKAAAYEKAATDHPGIDTLIISNFDSSQAFRVLRDTGKPIEVNFRRSIKAEQYEFRGWARFKEQTADKASAPIPKTATVEHPGDLARFEGLVADVEAIWEPWLRTRPKELRFEGIGTRCFYHIMSERRWSQVPRWLVEE